MIDDIETIAANSYANFHAKGLHYLCLYRSPRLTKKVYFFEGTTPDSPEVINPHDHRYPFYTRCLLGEVTNHIYQRVPQAIGHSHRFDEFNYMTPLNGGNGFAWKGEAHLLHVSSLQYQAGWEYFSDHTNIHTITVQPGTVLGLRQFDDVVDVSEPTSTFCRNGREPPSLSGLYDRMTVDRVCELLRRYQAVMEF